MQFVYSPNLERNTSASRVKTVLHTNMFPIIAEKYKEPEDCHLPFIINLMH